MADITLSPRGPAGANGLNLYTSTDNPLPSDGRDNESWLNTRTLTLFKKVTGVWGAVASLEPAAPKPGIPGAAGKTIYSDEGPPSSQLGTSGDFYVQKSATKGIAIYGPKAGSTWPPGVALVTLLVGQGPPQNDIGLDGQTYVDTTNAVLYGAKTSGAWPPGTTLRGLLVGSGAPNATTGYDGQTYIDTAAVAFYGPKAGGVWPNTPTPLVGLLTGSGAPANTLGLDGQTYIDRTNFALYGPKAAGAWPTGVSFLGKAPLKPVEAWASGVAYTAGPPSSFVSINGSSYQCLISHTSGSNFTTDLSAGRWGLVASKGADGTGTGTVTPAGTITTGTVAVFADATGTLITSGPPPFTRGQIVALAYGPDSLS